MYYFLLFAIPCITIAQFDWGPSNIINKTENKNLCKSEKLNTHSQKKNKKKTQEYQN